MRFSYLLLERWINIMAGKGKKEKRFLPLCHYSCKIKHYIINLKPPCKTIKTFWTPEIFNFLSSRFFDIGNTLTFCKFEEFYVLSFHFVSCHKLYQDYNSDNSDNSFHLHTVIYFSHLLDPNYNLL